MIGLREHLSAIRSRCTPRKHLDLRHGFHRGSARDTALSASFIGSPNTSSTAPPSRAGGPPPPPNLISSVSRFLNRLAISFASAQKASRSSGTPPSRTPKRKTEHGTVPVSRASAYLEDFGRISYSSVKHTIAPTASLWSRSQNISIALVEWFHGWHRRRQAAEELLFD